MLSCTQSGCFMVMAMVWQCHLSASECRCYRLNGFSLFKRLPIPLSSGSRTLEQSVGEWLESIGLQQYESKLLLNGFDDVHFLVSACRPLQWSILVLLVGNWPPCLNCPRWSLHECVIPYLREELTEGMCTKKSAECLMPTL